MQRWARSLAVTTLAVAVLVSGCGVPSAESYVRQHYALENVQGTGGQMQKIYRAPNSDVPAVAKGIAGKTSPDEVSATSEERMFLVYPNHVIHVQQDPQNTDDVLVELNTMQFVRDNYDPSFLHGFLAASLISSMFGSNWRSYPPRGYTGYGDYYRSRDPRTSPGYRSPSPSYRTPVTTPPRSGGGTGRVIRRRR